MRSTAFIIVIVVPALPATPSAAHDHWLNGQEVDPILKLRCCGPDDTKVVDGLVRFSPGGDSIYFADMPGAQDPVLAGAAVSRRPLVEIYER